MSRYNTTRICWTILALSACGSTTLGASDGLGTVSSGADSTASVPPIELSPVPSVAADTIPPTEVPTTDSEGAVGAGLPLIDDKIKVSDRPLIAEYPTFDTVEELFAASDAVVVGRMIETRLN